MIFPSSGTLSHSFSRPFPTGRRMSFGVVLLALWCIVALSAPLTAQRPSEYQVKAAFLFNFPNFVEWPREILADTTTTLTIGVLGKDPFGDAFTPFLDKRVKGRKTVVHRSTRLQELPFCHVLFICESERKFLPQILEHVEGRGVLTIGESEGFAQNGVVINFVLQGNKVRFQINVDSAARAGLKLSAKLLELALIVQEARE